MKTTRSLSLSLLVIALCATTSSAYGQRRGWRRVPPKFPDAATLADRRFIFSRVLYTSVRRERGGQGWFTDYPDADRNLMERLSEFTKTPISRDPQGEPNHVVVQLTDDAIFSFPFLFMSDVGTIGFSPEETRRLREFLLKGGFLYVDDFWGPYAWAHWEAEINKVLPRGEYPTFDVEPDHPLRHTLYTVAEIPQIPSIQHWRRTGGVGTSERGIESATPHLRAIADKSGRIIVLMSHNTDIADGWEREGEELEFFQRFSFDSYALGFNIVLYAMSH